MVGKATYNQIKWFFLVPNIFTKVSLRVLGTLLFDLLAKRQLYRAKPPNWHLIFCVHYIQLCFIWKVFRTNC